MTEPIRGANKQQHRAAELREMGLDTASIARELGLSSYTDARDLLKYYDKHKAAYDLAKTAEDEPDQQKKKEKKEAAVRSRKRVRTKQGAFNIKTETKNAKVLRLMEEARVLALTFLDGEVLQKETGRGLAQIIATLTDKIQLLRGEPTTISRVEDVRKMDDILKVLQDEIEKRGIKEEKVVN